MGSMPKYLKCKSFGQINSQVCDKEEILPVSPINETFFNSKFIFLKNPTDFASSKGYYPKTLNCIEFLSFYQI